MRGHGLHRSGPSPRCVGPRSSGTVKAWRYSASCVLISRSDGSGSGVIVARLANGKWSPPSAILTNNTVAWKNSVPSADVHDCVCVINNEAGMELLHQHQGVCKIGVDLTASVEPLFETHAVGSGMSKPKATEPCTFVKGKGQYAEIELNGLSIVERTSENERFYNVRAQVSIGLKHCKLGVRRGLMSWAIVRREYGYEILKNKDCSGIVSRQIDQDCTFDHLSSFVSSGPPGLALEVVS